MSAVSDVSSEGRYNPDSDIGEMADYLFDGNGIINEDDDEDGEGGTNSIGLSDGDGSYHSISSFTDHFDSFILFKLIKM